MSACVPEIVSVAEPFAPALIDAPPASVTLSTPLATVSCVVARLPSASATEIVLPPVNARAVSSATICAPGTVLTGGMATVPEAENSDV